MTDWHQAALCRGTVPTAAFFAGETPAPEAEAACRRCTVKAECLEEALAWSDDNDAGYRAGLTAAERRKLRALRRKGAA